MSEIRRRPSRDDDDDRPRRRRDEDEADEAPRPRRKRDEEELDQLEEVGSRRLRRDDPDEDDRPRRRRDEDDEERVEERPRKKKKKSKTPSVGSMDVFIWIGLGVGGLVLVGVLIFALSYMFHDPFYKDIDKFTVAAAGQVPAGQPRPTVAKVVAIDMGARKTDASHWYIDGQYKASKPDEVTTVLQVSWRSEVVGHYSNGGGPASKWHASATLIDLKTRAILGQQNFTGSEPPQSISVRRGSFSGSGRSGDKPLTQIGQWVSQMAGMR
jgi:hypothetical protein